MAWAQALPRLTRYPPEPPVAQVPRRWQDPSRRVLPAIGLPPNDAWATPRHHEMMMMIVQYSPEPVAGFQHPRQDDAAQLTHLAPAACVQAKPAACGKPTTREAARTPCTAMRKRLPGGRGYCGSPSAQLRTLTRVSITRRIAGSARIVSCAG